MTEIYVPDKLLYVIDALAEKGFDGYLEGIDVLIKNNK